MLRLRQWSLLAFWTNVSTSACYSYLFNLRAAAWARLALFPEDIGKTQVTAGLSLRIYIVTVRTAALFDTETHDLSDGIVQGHKFRTAYPRDW